MSKIFAWESSNHQSSKGAGKTQIHRNISVEELEILDDSEDDRRSPIANDLNPTKNQRQNSEKSSRENQKSDSPKAIIINSLNTHPPPNDNDLRTFSPPPEPEDPPSGPKDADNASTKIIPINPITILNQTGSISSMGHNYISSAPKSPNRTPNGPSPLPLTSKNLPSQSNQSAQFSPKTNENLSLSDSTSLTGPLFPPGFEDKIPNHIKIIQERKRNKKLQKKKRLRSSSAYGRSSSKSLNTKEVLTTTIQVEDVIGMANLLGLTFDGPAEVFKERVAAILSGQQKDWIFSLS